MAPLPIDSFGVRQNVNRWGRASKFPQKGPMGRLIARQRNRLGLSVTYLLDIVVIVLVISITWELPWHSRLAVPSVGKFVAQRMKGGQALYLKTLLLKVTIKFRRTPRHRATSVVCDLLSGCHSQRRYRYPLAGRGSGDDVRSLSGGLSVLDQDMGFSDHRATTVRQ